MTPRMKDGDAMPAEIIAKYLTAALGIDVGISFDDPAAPREVTVYRPDRLSDDFVALAFQALEETAPDALRRIEVVHVTFDTPLGRSRRRVDFRGHGAHLAGPAAA